jgi:hypothetical protein
LPTKGNSNKNAKKKEQMLIRGRCFKPMQFKFRLYKMNSNHWRPNLLI